MNELSWFIQSGIASEKIDLQNIFQLKEAFDAADADGIGKLELSEVFFKYMQ